MIYHSGVDYSNISLSSVALPGMSTTDQRMNQNPWKFKFYQTQPLPGLVPVVQGINSYPMDKC